MPDIAPELPYGPGSRLRQFIAQTSNVRETLRVLWRRRMLILSIVLLATVLAYLAVKRIDPQYTATAKVMIETRGSQIVNIKDVMEGLRPSRITFLGEVEVIRSRELAKRVIERLDLAASSHFNPELRKPDGDFSLNPLVLARQLMRSILPVEARVESDEARDERVRNQIINSFLSRLSVRPVSLSPVIDISVTTPDPALSSKVANAVAEAYLASQLEAKFDATKRATVWLNERLEDLRIKVRDSERAAAEYRAEHGMVAGRSNDLTGERLSDLNARYILAQSERTEVEARYQAVQDVLARGGSVGTTADVLRSPQMQRLQEQESVLARKVAELSTRYRERHPKMIDAKSELEDVRAKLKAEVSKVGSALKSELDIVSARERSLRNAMRQAEGAAATQGTAAVTLRELEREAEANRLIYETFLSRFKETSQQQDLQQADARILSGAVPPLVPSAPRKGLILSVVLLVACAASVALALFLELMDVGLKSAEQVEALTGLPVLSMVPKVPGGKAPGKIGRYVIDQPLSAAAEAVRNVLTSLRLARPDDPVRRVSFTSAVAGEGKSTLCLWLARVAAGQGLKVVLVDSDLRRPRLHRILEMDNRVGIVDVIAGTTSLEAAIRRDEASGVDVLTARETPGNALEVLGSATYQRTVEALSSRYDLVLIDAPPVLAVSDARVLGQVVDTTIYVIRWDSDKMAVASALKQIEVSGGKLLGTVVTQVDTRRHARYGYGDYGHYYGQYSGYYNQG